MAQQQTDTAQRQAVVIIHGIGEQRPIETLRGLVKGIAKHWQYKNGAGKEALFWEKPDHAYGNYETRKMTLLDEDDNSKTDFFELYWAHHMQQNSFLHIKDWLSRILFRMPQTVPQRLRPIFYFLWVLIIAFVFLIVLGIVHNDLSDFEVKIKTFLAALTAIFVVGIISKPLFEYLGDAGRYLDPKPSNISERQAIRQEGVKLLQKLQDSGRYNRIVLVGHSLGSVIAYDLVKFLWNDNFKDYDPQKAEILYKNREPNDVATPIYRSQEAGEKLQRGEINIDQYQQYQEEGYEYYKAIGNKWLLTDLVTIGSPLTYAGYLFADNYKIFEELKAYREYPTCPPLLQDTVVSNIEDSEQTLSNGIRVKRFNHSSPFGITKWTNFYYTSDYIGGALQNSFGVGIKDVEVERKNGLFLIPSGHTAYWDSSSKSNIINALWEIIFGE